MTGHTRQLVLAAAVGTLLAACGSTEAHTAGPDAAPPSTTSTPSTPSTPRAPASPTVSAVPSGACLDAAQISGWPVERRAATVITLPLADFDLDTVAPELTAGASGVLLLGSTAVPADLAARIRTAAARAGSVAPPLVMADQEGGGIQRLRGAVPDLPWPRDLAATTTVTATEQRAAALGRAMAVIGVNVDLAPVLDVDARPGPSDANPDGRRSFSGVPDTVSRYGVAFLNGLRKGGVLTVVKHFPGLGGSSGNTDARPAATKSIAALRAADLAPFRAAISAGVPAVMISNATVPGMTSHPAGLSSAVIGGLLRKELGFTGLVVTDSLSAGAVRAVTASLGEAATDAIESGADLILFGSTRTAADVAALTAAGLSTSFQQIVAALRAALASGALTDARLDEAVTHVLAARGAHLCS